MVWIIALACVDAFVWLMFIAAMRAGAKQDEENREAAQRERR